MKSKLLTKGLTQDTYEVELTHGEWPSDDAIIRFCDRRAWAGQVRILSATLKWVIVYTD